MANKDAPFGLRPVGELGSSIQNGGTSKYLITSNDSQAIYKGDLVKLEATGYITKSDDSDSVQAIGVFNGCFYIAPTTKKPTWSNYYPGSITPDSGNRLKRSSMMIRINFTKFNLMVLLLKPALVEIPIIVYAAGSTVNGQSKSELDATVESAGVTGQFRIIRICEDPDNSDISADNSNWIVRINEHQYYNNGLGV